MISLVLALAAAAAQPLTNAPGAITPAPFLIDCLFQKEVSVQSQPFTKRLSILLRDGVKFGPIDHIEVSDPSNLIAGGQFNFGKAENNRGLSLLGTSTTHPVLIIFPPKDGSSGYEAGLRIAGQADARFGRCFLVAGPAAESIFKDRQSNRPERGE